MSLKTERYEEWGGYYVFPAKFPDAAYLKGYPDPCTLASVASLSDPFLETFCDSRQPGGITYICGTRHSIIECPASPSSS